MEAVKLQNDQSVENTNDDQVQALNANFAVIEFEANGTILHANDNFLSTMGYGLNEIVGQHHRIFCDDETVNDPSYKQFWSDLANGGSKVADFKRKRKDGSIVWISASYTPVRDESGAVFKVIKIAQDKTEELIRKTENTGTVTAINRS